MLEFNNVSLLSLDQESQYLGKAFLYRNVRKFSIDGFFYVNNNTEGVGPIWQEIDNFLQGKHDFQEIRVNGKSFGIGKFISVNFQESNDVRLKRYTAELESYVEGDLSNMGNDFYQGIVTTNWHLIPSISESFRCEKNDDGEKNYSHSVEVRFENQGDVNDAIDLAKQVAKNLIEALHVDGEGLYFEYEDTLSRKRYYEESINLIDGTYSVDESIRYSKAVNEYSLDLEHSIEISEDGITNVSEKGSIKSLALEDRYSKLLTALKQEVINSKDRCHGVFDTHSVESVDKYELSQNFISLSKQINKFDATASYSVSYSNDPKINETYSLEFTQEIDKSDGYYKVSENGRVAGFGLDFDDKWANALAGWNNRKVLIESELIARYNDQGNSFLPLKPISKSNSYSRFGGTVEYSRAYTNDPSYVLEENIRRMEINIEDELPVEAYNAFEILNGREIVQKRGIHTIGTRSLTASVIGKRNANLENYLDFIKKHINRYIPNGEDVHISNVSYNLNPFSNQFQCNVSWNYLVNWSPDNGVINQNRF